MINISIIIVSYNCKKEILECLNSIYKSFYKDLEVIVVDNNSNDDSIKIIRENFKNVILIENKKNLGFAKACNLGAKIAKGKYLFFLNPDTELKQNSLYNFVNFIKTKNNINIVGAKLLWPDNTFQDSYKRFFNFFHSILELFEIHYYFPNNYLNKKVNYNFQVFDKPREVDWVIGAAFIIEDKIFKEINGFDENFFMYFEEIDLCKRVRNKNYKIWFLPSFEVIHKHGKSSEKTNIRSIEYYKSMYYYHLKNQGYIPAIFIRISIFIMCVIFLFILFIKYLILKDKDYRIKRIKDKIILLKWSIGL